MVVLCSKQDPKHSSKIEFIHPQVFAKEVIEKVQELDQEKMKTEKAFHDFLPLTIVRDIKLKKVLQS